MTDELRRLIESDGWVVSEEGEQEYRLSKYSPRGQDFSIVIFGENDDELFESLDEVHENFDVSYETYIWLGSDGHGQNGAPHEMRDVLEDMEACEANILALYNLISKKRE